MESKVFGDTLGLWALCFIKINNFPLLMSTSVIAPNSNLLSFFVFTSSNVKDLVVVPVDELAILILEDLPPS
jgi:hypothetical protein